MAKRRIKPIDGLAAIDAIRADSSLRTGDSAMTSPVLATAVRFLLEDLSERIPGNSVEVRVPLFGAVQCVPGPDHRRGTPPNVVEMSAQTWLALALGETDTETQVASGALIASGVRALEFASVLPLMR